MTAKLPDTNSASARLVTSHKYPMRTYCFQGWCHLGSGFGYPRWRLNPESAHIADAPRLGLPIITVPANLTFLPTHTSPLMVKWSSSVMSGIDLNRFSKLATFLKVSPSLTTGVPWNSRDGFYSDTLANFAELRRATHHGQNTVFKVVQARLDQQQIRA